MQEVIDNIDDTIQVLMAAFDIPGVQACVILHDSVVWAGAYRFMDLAESGPVTDSTLFLLASVSKTVFDYGPSAMRRDWVRIPYTPPWGVTAHRLTYTQRVVRR